MQNFINKALPVFAVGAFFYLLFAVPRNVPRIHMLEGATMGTTWHVQVVANEQQTAQEAGAAIKGLLAHLDRAVFSTWTTESELSRLNRSAPNVPHPASSEMLEVLQLAQAIYRNSRNTFDVSIGPLVNLWGFGPEPFEGTPGATAVAEARARLGLDALQLNVADGTVTFARPLTLDLSGIAQGYAADAVAVLLEGLRFEAFLAEVGGEVRLQGRRPDGKNWILAVERPEDGPPEVYARLDTRGEALAVSVSGDYHNYREINGQRYAHSIDPRTGMPVMHALASVTVIGDTAAAADAWSTALMVLGPEEGMEVADSEGLAAYFIMRTPTGFQHRYTPAFAGYLQQAPGLPSE